MREHPDLQRYRRAEEELFEEATRYQYDDATIHRVFGDEPIEGIYRLYSVHDREVIRSDSRSDLKRELLTELHDRSGTSGPLEYFRFVTREQLAERLPDLRRLL